MRLMKNFGFAGYDNVVYIGTNGKMSEMSAAMGLTGLESLDEFITVNRAPLCTLCGGIKGCARAAPAVGTTRTEQSNYQYVVVDIDAAETGIARDALMEMLWAENVRARRYFYPGCHRMEPYRSLYPMAHRWLPVTEAVVERVLVLPTGTAVDAHDIRSICGLLRLAIENHTEFSHALDERHIVPPLSQLRRNHP